MSMLLRDAVKAAIRAGCEAADVHLMCSYPRCTCTGMPRATSAAIAAFLRQLPIEPSKVSQSFAREVGATFAPNNAVFYSSPVLADAVEKSVR